MFNVNAHPIWFQLLTCGIDCYFLMCMEMKNDIGPIMVFFVVFNIKLLFVLVLVEHLQHIK